RSSAPLSSNGGAATHARGDLLEHAQHDLPAHVAALALLVRAPGLAQREHLGDRHLDPAAHGETRDLLEVRHAGFRHDADDANAVLLRLGLDLDADGACERAAALQNLERA